MKNILITGVSRGIGRTLAEHFHKLGFYVYGGYKWSGEYKEEEEEAEALKSKLPNLTLLAYDLADRQAVAKLIKQLEGVELHGLINNAAEFLQNPFNDFSIENWERSLAVNLTAPLLLVHGCKSNLVEGAAIINIASTDAQYAAYDDIGYSASKAAFINLTKSMAAALAGKKIRVNTLAPGWVDTQMAESAGVNEYAHYQTPLGRNATTQEIANVAEFLISEKSSFITATVINVDGGYSSIDYVVKKESES